MKRVTGSQLFRRPGPRPCWRVYAEAGGGPLRDERGSLDVPAQTPRLAVGAGGNAW